MYIDILLIVAITSFIQSVFGVGVLLFGTPLLMLQGYNFFQTIVILLPISLFINFFQIVKDYKSLDKKFYRNILIYTIPCIVIFLIFVKETNINIGILVGIFLLVVSLKDLSPRAKKIATFLTRYEKSYFILMGIIHGLTNLGGALLTAFVNTKDYEKNVIRSNIAITYATFAAFQILTLLVFGIDIDTKFSVIASSIIVGLIVFFSTEKIIFQKINSIGYKKIFSGFVFLSGLILILKSI